MSIKDNTTSLQELLSIANNLPVNTSLPELTNEGTESDLMSGKELIGSDGKTVVTGTFSIDDELSTQEDLISEQSAKIAELAQILNGKATGGVSIETCTVDISIIGKDYPFGSDYGTIVYTTFENEKMVAKRLDVAMKSLSINTVCNSFLIINEGASRLNHSFSGLELIEGSAFATFVADFCFCFYVTASADETATLIIEMD